MISRRSIRSKSFQVIYSQQFNDDPNVGAEAVNFFSKNVERVYYVYFFNTALILKLIKLLQEKNLLPESEVPSLADFKKLILDASSTTNSNKIIVRALADFNAKYGEEEPAINEFIERVPNRLSETKLDSPAALYKWLQSDNDYNELFGEMMVNGQGSDDYSIITGTVRKTVKAFPAVTEINNVIHSDDDTTIQFGDILISQYFADDGYYTSLIEAQSRNWEIDRVALIDKILIKMALVEMVSFPSIPINVTINEYIEISKAYSLDKSKEFINGILDKVSKKLEKDGKIVKDEMGKQTGNPA